MILKRKTVCRFEDYSKISLLLLMAFSLATMRWIDSRLYHSDGLHVIFMVYQKVYMFKCDCWYILLEIDRYIGLPIFFPIFKHFTIIGYRFCKKKNIVFYFILFNIYFFFIHT